MGIIRAVTGAIGGSLADQWLEVLEPENMNDTTVFTRGVQVRKDDKRNQNKKGTTDTVSNGSIIHVYPNQCMLLMDGGKVIDYTCEEGYYKVDNSSLPSMFNGELGASVKESFQRIKYGGTPSSTQKVFFINLQEIKGIKFGTKHAVNYFDNFYNAELFLRTHGTYSIKIKDPIRFYEEAIPKNRDRVDINDINEQYLDEFLDALRSSINQMSADGVRISHVASKGKDLSKYMSSTLNEDWLSMRGIEVQSVGLASISYDDESKQLINMRNQGAMLQDPTVREGYVQGSMARGMEASGSHDGGGLGSLVGMGLGMHMANQVTQNTPIMNQQPPVTPAPATAPAPQPDIDENTWACECGEHNTGKFCKECGKQKPDNSPWTCECGTNNNGKFCPNCGKPKPIVRLYRCDKCGYELSSEKSLPKFCPECGDPVTDDDIVE